MNYQRGKIQPGELREKIDICTRKTETDRKTGVQKIVYETVLSTRAKVLHETGREFMGADAEQRQIKKRMVLRKRSDLKLNAEYFIKYQDRVYNIYDMIPVDVFFYELRLEEVRV